MVSICFSTAMQWFGFLAIFLLAVCIMVKWAFLAIRMRYFTSIEYQVVNLKETTFLSSKSMYRAACPFKI